MTVSSRPLCGGLLRSRKGTCTRPAGWGTPHPGVGSCKLHLGSTPNHVAGVIAARIQAEMATYGEPRNIDPMSALLEEVKFSAGHVEWLRGQVAALEPEALTWGIAERAEKGATEFQGTDVTERAALNVWLEAYHRERRYLLDVSKAALAAGADERLVTLAEQGGAQLAGIFLALLDHLAASTEQRAVAARVVPLLLRGEIVSAGPARP